MNQFIIMAKLVLMIMAFFEVCIGFEFSKIFAIFATTTTTTTTTTERPSTCKPWWSTLWEVNERGSGGADSTLTGNVRTPVKLLFTNVITICIALIALRYMWKYREEVKLLQSTLAEKEREQTAVIRNIKSQQIPLPVIYGFGALLRVGERTICQIKYIALALEHLPKFSVTYGKLQEKLKRLQDLDGEITQAIRTYEFFGVSNRCYAYRHEEQKILSILRDDSTFSPCPLEQFINFCPIQQSFWINASATQTRKLEREYAKLKNNYPDISEIQIRAAMVYAYNNFKRDIFSITSRKLELMVRRLCVDGETEENPGLMPELCSICLEEINNNEIATLSCNHLFHQGCINPWLAQSRSCPMCRSFVGRS